MEINPYSSERNPYHDMSSEMMLFRAAYPIRYDREKRFYKYSKTVNWIKCKNIQNVSWCIIG